MKFHRPDATISIPDGQDKATALRRTTHLGIGAHQDDLEIMALHGILSCYNRKDRWFGGVVCTNGEGSPRAGEYATYSNKEMASIRRREQEKAADIGEYGFLAQLNYTSAEIKTPGNNKPRKDLVKVLEESNPDIVYTHNPADKHETHVAVSLIAIAAMRALPQKNRPQTVYGCEVWRNLEWMADTDKVPLDVSTHENLAMALIGVYDSQVSGGKRYDLATLGRRRANATYFATHDTDETEQLWFAMDLTPLIHDDSRDVVDFVLGYVEKFRKDIESRIRRYQP